MRLFYVCLCIFILLVGIAFLAPTGAPHRYFQEGTCGRASLTYVGEVPVLHLYGSPEEMGHQYGTLLASQIRLLIGRYLPVFSTIIRHGTPKSDTMRRARQMEKRIPPHIISEMKAIASAADIPYEKLLLSNTLFDIKKAFQCGTFVAYDGATSGGLRLFARNLDFHNFGILHHYGIIIVYHPQKGCEFVSITYPGYVGVISGMNEVGLSIAVMEAYGYSARSDRAPYAIQFRRLLETCESGKDARTFLEAARFTTANNLMVCPARDTPFVAELTPEKKAFRYPRRGIIYATNSFHSKGLNQKKKCPRYAEFGRFSEAYHGRIDADLLKMALGLTYMKMLNVQAMIFEPSRLRLHIAIGNFPAAKGPYTTLDDRVFHFGH